MVLIAIDLRKQATETYQIWPNNLYILWAIRAPITAAHLL